MLEPATIHVFVPVHNEGRYIGATLKSVEEATDDYLKYGKIIKVTVSDNYSNDGSAEIISKFADRNPSWEIRKTSRLLSSDEHFNSLIQSCKTKFICIIGGHDLISVNYFHNLEQCISVNQDIVLAFSKEYVDESGEGKNATEVAFQYNFSNYSSERFWQSIFYLGNATCFQGLISARYLQCVNASESQVSDLVWLHGLLKFGRFSYCNESAYIRTNPIRLQGNLNPKIRKLSSNRTKMEIAMIAAWIPVEFWEIRKKLASFIIKLKFNNNPTAVMLFRLIRKISQLWIPPASKGKVFSNTILPFDDILFGRI